MFSEKICTFCGSNIEPSIGITYVKNDGVTMYFCTSKCRKNSLVLKRDPRKYKWTQSYTKPTSKQ